LRELEISLDLKLPRVYMNQTFFKKQTSQEKLEATSNFIDELKELKKQKSSELSKVLFRKSRLNQHYLDEVYE